MLTADQAGVLFNALTKELTAIGLPASVLMSMPASWLSAFFGLSREAQERIILAYTEADCG